MFGSISPHDYTVLEVTCVRIWAYPISLHRCDFKHFLLGEFEVEDINVFLDPAWSDRFHQRQHARLHHPADDHLGHALAMVGSN